MRGFRFKRDAGTTAVTTAAQCHIIASIIYRASYAHISSGPAMNTSELLFNIIYTPGSVALLSPFVQSLLKWSDCRYQLIANGCDNNEQRLLRNLANSDSRLQYLCLSDTKMISHSDALDKLQQDCNDEWFCAMDSDIFAQGPFLDAVAGAADGYNVITSCLPVWTTPGDATLKRAYKRLQGLHIRLANGLTVGCTYFVLYRNADVSRARALNGVGFERYYWDKIPDRHQQTIRSLDAEKHDYDTAIVLNMLIIAGGGKVTYLPLDNLKHLGGLSSISKTTNTQFCRGFIDAFSIKWKHTLLTRPTMWLGDLLYGTRNIVEKLSLREYINLAGRARRRAASALYFAAVLKALINSDKLPETPHLANTTVEKELEETAAILHKNYQA